MSKLGNRTKGGQSSLPPSSGGPSETSLRKLVGKIGEIERDISTEKGEFLLFAFLLRDRGLDLWDLLISAYWIPLKKREALEFIIGKLSQKLTKQEMKRISRVVILNPTDTFVRNMQRFVSIEHGLAEVQDCVFNQTPVAHAFIVTSKRMH